MKQFAHVEGLISTYQLEASTVSVTHPVFDQILSLYNRSWVGLPIRLRNMAVADGRHAKNFGVRKSSS